MCPLIVKRGNACRWGCKTVGRTSRGENLTCLTQVWTVNVCLVSGHNTSKATLPHAESCCIHALRYSVLGVRDEERGWGLVLHLRPLELSLWVPRCRYVSRLGPTLVVDHGWTLGQTTLCSLTHGWVSSPSFCSESCSLSSWAQLSERVSQLCKQAQLSA